MATQTGYRVGIWIIAVVMTVGTLAGFVAMMLQPKNQATDAAQQAQARAQYIAQMKEEHQKAVRPLDGYVAEAFDAANVTGLKVDVLKQGDGAPLNPTDTLKANYFGWTADGKIFDSTNMNGTTTPSDQLSLSGVIPGWKQGLVGQKIGSIVKLTIPAELAYGSTDDGTGKPTGPLMFIVEILGIK